jgi:hypothetical protein
MIAASEEDTMSSSCRGRRQPWMRWCGQSIFAAGAGLLLLSVVSDRAQGVSLQSLVNGGTLNVGNSRFSNWELTSLDASDAALPNLSLIDVVPLIDAPPLNPGIQFVANGQFATAGISAIDLNLKFRANAVGGSNTFVGQTLALTGLTFGGSGGIMYVSGDLTSGAGSSIGPTLAIADNELPFFQFTNSTVFTPKAQVQVAMNVFLTGLIASDVVTLSTFTQRFSQTGPPGLPGDYNQNGVVDAADYTTWRDHLGQPAGSLANDVDGGAIGQAQYNTWKANFGAMNGAAAITSVSAGVAVPEPAALVLTLVAVAMLFLGRRPKLRRIWLTGRAV